MKRILLPFLLSLLTLSSMAQDFSVLKSAIHHGRGRTQADRQIMGTAIVRENGQYKLVSQIIDYKTNVVLLQITYDKTDSFEFVIDKSAAPSYSKHDWTYTPILRVYDQGENKPTVVYTGWAEYETDKSLYYNFYYVKGGDYVSSIEDQLSQAKQGVTSSTIYDVLAIFEEAAKMGLINRR